jgi:hypothetical protein
VFRETAVDYLSILTTDDYIPALARFLAGRTRQAR